MEAEKESDLPQPDRRTPTCECHFRQGQSPQRPAPTKGAKTPESHYWRSRAYNELALQSFTRLGQLPPSLEQHELKANIYNGQKKYADAVEEWREALKLSPTDKQIQKQLAISLKFSQDYGAALAILQKLLEGQPASAELSFLVGETLVDLQRVEEAIPLLNRALAGDPQLLAAHKPLARAYLAAGKAAQAIPHLQAALATDEDGSLHYQLASAHAARSQPDRPKQALLKYQKI